VSAALGSAAAEARAARARRLRLLLAQVGVGIALLGVWEVLDLSGRYGIWIGNPVRTAARLVEWIGSGELWPHLTTTLTELAIGYVLGGAVGVVLGVGLGLLPRQGRAWDPLIRGLNAIPRFALAPLFILWLGIGLLPKVALVATAVGYILLSTTLDGVRRVDQDVLVSVRIMGASRWQVTTKVLLPSALSAIVLGARLAIPYGLVATIAAELLVGVRGLGYLLSRASGYLEMDQMFADIVVIMALGIILNVALGARTRAWQSSNEVADRGW
jgi:NitT/TauT family transport system permease protein